MDLINRVYYGKEDIFFRVVESSTATWKREHIF